MKAEVLVVQVRADMMRGLPNAIAANAAERARIGGELEASRTEAMRTLLEPRVHTAVKVVALV